MINWIKRFFKNGAATTAAPKSSEPATPSGAKTGESPGLPAYDIVATTVTDVGCHRKVNEDRIRYVTLAEPDAASQGALLLVADGMGGHAGGEVASTMAVDIISRVMADRGWGDPHGALHEALRTANQAIYQAARKDQALQGMGTTCTALVVKGHTAFCAHVGDSRLYLLRNNELYLLSEDHSLVREMVKQGMLTSEEARSHEEKNVILRALGLHATVEVTLWTQPLSVRTGDCFMVCSDGLYDLIEDAEIKAVLLEHETHEAGQRLIALARERGGYDNITVGLLHLRARTVTDDTQARTTRSIEHVPQA